MDRSRVTLVFAALACATLTAIAAGPAHGDTVNGKWIPMDQLPPGPPLTNAPGRTSHSLVYDSVKDRMIMFGGDPGFQNQLWTLDLTPGANWTQVFPAGPTPDGRYGHMAIFDPVGNRMIIFGGNSYEGWRNDTWELTLSGTPTWDSLSTAGTPPLPRQDGAAVYDPVGQRMIVFGGASGDSFYSDLWQLSLTGTPTWTPLSPSGPTPPARDLCAYAYDSDHGSLVMFGGWDGFNYMGDTWELSLAGSGTWAPIFGSGTPSNRREGVGIYDPAGQRFMFFSGLGNGNVHLNETWALSLSGPPAWTHLAPAGTVPSARSGSRGFYDALRSRMVIFGGVNENYDNDTRALSLSGPLAWSNLFADDSDRIPARRDNSSAIRTGTQEMFTFGGATPSEYPFFPSPDVNEIWRLKVASPYERWTELDPTGLLPAPRHGQRAVWDPVRDRMLVVGGYDGNYENDVWAFYPDPLSHWSSIPTSGIPPDGRMLFGLDYDPLRDRLILVGGHSGFPPTSVHPYWGDVWALPLSGPSANTWIPLSPSGTPPTPRWIYGMQYDPPHDRMVFFGGVTELGRTNETWALNLGGGTSWEQLLPTGALPDTTSDHAMVYDPYQSRMVVFGGFNNHTFSNRTMALSLTSPPSWSELHPDGATPPGRDIFSAIFDPIGDQMVFLGGFNGSLPNPFLQDTWSLSWEPPIVAALASLAASSATPEGVHLDWLVPTAANVESRIEKQSNGGWAPAGVATRVGPDHLVFDDSDVQPGAHLTYRLWLRSGTSETLANTTSIDVPNGLRFALEGVRPNPSAGDRLSIAFSLPRAESAKLEVLDLAGRRVASQDLSAAGAGRHVIAVTPQRALDPGVYLVRLSGADGAKTVKVSVMR